MKHRTILFVFFIMLMTACSTQVKPTTEPELTSMVFMAGYIPQANLPLLGVYVAQEKGFFDQENLDVTIQHSSGSGDHLQLLTAGEVHVVSQDAAILLKRRADPGLPLVSIALLGQRGQQAFVALADSGIETPKDWEGHTVGYKGAQPPDLFALIAAAGADIDKIEFINVGFDPRVLTEGLVDVYPVFKSNEPNMIRSWGYALNQWDASDYGVPTLGLTYSTTDEILKHNPEMLASFLRAAFKGITYATENPDEAIEIVLLYTGPETDPDHQRFMFETELIDAYGEATEEHGLGWQTAEQWGALAEMLASYDILVPEDINTVFTTQILEAIAPKR